jgi:tetratricopeptide (TPR) repeat protein
MEGGRFATAAEALTRAIEREPKSPDLYYHRANAYRAQERWEEAFADAIRALDRDARNPSYYVLRGAIYRQYFKDVENAERDLTQALELDPTLAAGYQERGILYHQMRLLNDAERDLRQALARRGTPEGVVALAAVLRDKGEYDKASEALRGAIESFPDPSVRKSLKSELERTQAAKEADR